MLNSQAEAHVLGVISDTHGLMRPEAIMALDGVETWIKQGIGQAATQFNGKEV